MCAEASCALKKVARKEGAMLELEDVTYVYNFKTPAQKMALRHISLTLNKGEFVALIGQTGSGKSTLIEQLNGLKKPSSGRVLWDGEDIWGAQGNLREIRFKIGVSFQFPESQIFEQDVFSELSFALKNMGLEPDEIHTRVNEALDFVELDRNILLRSPFDFSGGQKRRIAIASVIATRPEVLVLDEPTVGLDPVGAEKILERVESYRLQNGAAVVLVSHNMEEVARYATRVIVMNHGEIELDEATDDVFANPERLVSLGLDIPAISQMFWKLKDRGIPVNTSIHEVDEAVEEFFRLKSEDAKV